MDPLTYVANGFVREYGAFLALLVGVAAVVGVFAQLSLVVNVRRTMRAVEALALASGALQNDGVSGRGITTTAAPRPEAASATQ